MWMLIGKTLTNIQEDLWKYNVTAKSKDGKCIFNLQIYEEEYIFLTKEYFALGWNKYSTAGEAILNAMKLGYEVYIDDIEVSKPDL